jgi:transketolase
LRKAFVDCLTQMAEADEKIILITGDLGFGVLDRFINRFPNQFINAGVTEQSMMSMSAGLASTGYRVFVYSIGNFPTLRCLEQIRNDVCSMNNDVVIVSVGAGYSYGPQGYSHHAIEDLSIMRTLPNMQVLSPCNSYEVTSLTAALCSTSGPAYLRLGQSNEILENLSGSELKEGKFRLLKEGRDGAILFTGGIGEIAIQAANVLAESKIQMAVYSVPYVSFVDEPTLQEIAEFGLILTLEEQVGDGGFGSSIIEKLSDLNILCRTKRFYASRSDLAETGSQKYLQEFNGLSVNKIVNFVEDLLKQNS